VTDSFSQPIKEHTGQDNIVWHQEGSDFHLLGTSQPEMRNLLTNAVQNWKAGREAESRHYTILETNIEDHADPVKNTSNCTLRWCDRWMRNSNPFGGWNICLPSWRCTGAAAKSTLHRQFQASMRFTF
jgi:hypothetical protein